MKSESKQVEDFNIEKIINDILDTIKSPRERKIIAKRFGLFDRKETLEQIGETLKITRERVRQLEKSIMANLQHGSHAKIPHHKKIPHLEVVEAKFTKLLKEMGNVARIKDLGEKFSHINDHIHQARITFLGHLSPRFVILKGDDHHHHGIGLRSIHSHPDLRLHISNVVRHIAEVGEPISAQQIHDNLKEYKNPQHVHALATLSKKLSHLNHHWGLKHWPTVNPKNIRDKIFIVLRDNKKPMHFSQIAQSIRDNDNFDRNQVTVQAIHNELIKDSRFVLIGLGTYALKDWGYKKGTVSDVIYEILKKTGGPMDRDDIVKEVLKRRQVKQTTILLNLQCRPIFKKLKDGSYTLN